MLLSACIQGYRRYSEWFGYFSRERQRRYNRERAEARRRTRLQEQAAIRREIARQRRLELERQRWIQEQERRSWLLTPFTHHMYNVFASKLFWQYCFLAIPLYCCCQFAIWMVSSSPGIEATPASTSIIDPTVKVGCILSGIFVFKTIACIHRDGLQKTLREISNILIEVLRLPFYCAGAVAACAVCFITAGVAGVVCVIYFIAKLFVTP